MKPGTEVTYYPEDGKSLHYAATVVATKVQIRYFNADNPDGVLVWVQADKITEQSSLL